MLEIGNSKTLSNTVPVSKTTSIRFYDFANLSY